MSRCPLSRSTDWRASRDFCIAVSEYCFCYLLPNGCGIDERLVPLTWFVGCGRTWPIIATSLLAWMSVFIVEWRRITRSSSRFCWTPYKPMRDTVLLGNKAAFVRRTVNWISQQRFSETEPCGLMVMYLTDARAETRMNRAGDFSAN